MILELLTPLMLATAPQTTDGMATTYSHTNQTASLWGGSTKEIVASGSSTRTFMPNGNPYDNDFD